MKQSKQIQDKEYELKLLALKVKEKQKEIRLCNLKAREYKKQLKHNTLKPMPKGSAYTLEALVSPRYGSFTGANMRYQQ
jgi:hypothetical protein